MAVGLCCIKTIESFIWARSYKFWSVNWFYLAHNPLNEVHKSWVPNLQKQGTKKKKIFCAVQWCTLGILEMYTCGYDVGLTK